MSTCVLLQPAYLLHTWPYRETSALADLFTCDFGRIRLIAKGMRQMKSRYYGARPFTPLLISYQGKSDLLTLTDLEITGMPYGLAGEVLLCGFYLNELLMRLLEFYDPYPLLFSRYQQALMLLSEKPCTLEPVLRQFEFFLLSILGYGFSLDETDTKAPVLADHYYDFDPKRGLTSVPFGLTTPFKGIFLLNFKNDHWPDADTYLTAKKLMQSALAPLLGKKPLRTRAIFKELI